MTTKAATKEIGKKELSVSERFAQMIIREFSQLSGNGLSLTQAQKTLVQHLFITIDRNLQELELNRTEKGQKDKMPIVWQNVNMHKLAKDAIHRINLGLDAFIENHIHVVPYFNSKERKYDIDLRIGYAGKDYYRRKMATDPPVDIIYELIHETDKFEPVKKDLHNKVESYIFRIEKPFERGSIVGGFGYIMYENPVKNRLVIVTEKDFVKAQGNAKSNVFWKDYPSEMRYKTIVHRTTARLSPDPDKINVSYMTVEKEDDQEGMILQGIEEKANRTFIDIQPEAPEEGQGQKEQGQEEGTGQEAAADDEGPGF